MAPSAATDTTTFPLYKKISSTGDNGFFEIFAISWSWIISELLTTLIGISEIFWTLWVLSLSLIKNSEFWFEETPAALLLSKDSKALEIWLYVNPSEEILLESTSTTISSSVSP